MKMSGSEECGDRKDQLSLDLAFHDQNPGSSNDPIRQLLQQLKDELLTVTKGAGESGRRWLKGKGDQEVAKVQQIMSAVVAQIAEIQAKNRRLDLEVENMRHNHQRERFADRIEGLKALAEILKQFKELGMELEASVVWELISGDPSLPSSE